MSRGAVKRRGTFYLTMGSTRDDMARVLREVLAPLVRADGGRLYLVELTDSRVILHLGGRYAGSPGNTLTTRRILEPALWSVAPQVAVTVTAGALIPDGAERLDGD